MIERTVTVDAVCQSGKAILVSRADVLTEETAEQIGDHNNALWCKCSEKRPEGFDVSACAMPR